MLRLKQLRKEKGLTTVQAAEIFKVSKSTYNYWENGVYEIDFEKLKEIAKYFEVSIDYLLDNSELYYPKITQEERAVGWRDTKRINVTPIEDDMLYWFRELGEIYGTEMQQAQIAVIKNLVEVKK
ncbi:MAG: helix-turn-helix domain-containing protein [Clostridiales bacterium]|nr:helix-turn-helix domain-containing protein [Clostridiales bacterium]